MASILVIEDNEKTRQLLHQVLEHEGYEVLEASNGEEGLDLQRKTPADLIITDIIMSKKEGIETIVDLKIEFPNIKIIAMSGGGRVGPDNYLDLAASFGAERTFTKPFKFSELLTAIEELLTIQD